MHCVRHSEMCAAIARRTKRFRAFMQPAMRASLFRRSGLHDSSRMRTFIAAHRFRTDASEDSLQRLRSTGPAARGTRHRRLRRQRIAYSEGVRHGQMPSLVRRGSDRSTFCERSHTDVLKCASAP